MNKKHPPSKAPASLSNHKFAAQTEHVTFAFQPKSSKTPLRKIPQPVFPARPEIVVSKPFIKASTPLLVNWPTLIKVFNESAPTADRLRKFIVAEVQTRNRPTMLRRLLSRLHIVERQELMKVLKID